MSNVFTKKAALLTELAAIISLQGGASIAKYLFGVLGPAGTTFLRVGISCVVLMSSFRPKFWNFTKAQWRGILIYGISTGGMNLLFYYGIQRVPLGIGVGVEFIGPLCVALFSSRKLTDFVWAMLAAWGIALIIPWTQGEGSLDPIGLVLVALASILWGTYIVIGSRITNIIKPTDAVACGMVVAALCVLPVVLITGDLMRLDWRLFALGCGVAVFSSALPFTLEIIVMKKLPAKTFSILASLDPAVASLSGLIFLGERLTIVQTCAIACIMCASIGAALTAPEKK